MEPDDEPTEDLHDALWKAGCTERETIQEDAEERAPVGPPRRRSGVEGYLTPVRESALSYLPGEIASIVQSLSSWVLDSYVDGLTANQRTFRGSWPKMQLRAAMLDLRHTARWLAIAAESASASDLRSDVRLAGLADELALAVERFAGLIDEQIKGVGRGRSSGGRS
ncbi:MAG: hypothetical protein ACJ76J_05585 [Thermoanaerobaculia bacterium]